MCFRRPCQNQSTHENGVVLVSLVNLSRVSFSSGGGPPFGTGSATMSLSSLPFAMTVPPTTWEVATSPCPTMSSVKVRIGIVVSRRHLGWRSRRRTGRAGGYTPVTSFRSTSERDCGGRLKMAQLPPSYGNCHTGKFHFEPPFTSFDHLVGAGEQRRANPSSGRARASHVFPPIFCGLKVQIAFRLCAPFPCATCRYPLPSLCRTRLSLRRETNNRKAT